MLTVRLEAEEDIPIVRQLNEAAFGRTAEAQLVDSLRLRGRAAYSLVADLYHEIVGHVLFTAVTLEPPAHGLPMLALGPSAVVPKLQRQGVGTMLVERGLRMCADDGVAAVVVLGHPEFYPRFGFTPASRFGLLCEYEVPDDVFMALELRPGALMGVGGLVKYEPEFETV